MRVKKSLSLMRSLKQVSFKQLCKSLCSILLIAGCNATSIAAVSQYELYPNIHTIGISIRFNNPIGSVTGETFISIQSVSGWTSEKPGFQLSKVTDFYYAGCVFQTKPSTWYKVRCVLRSGATVIADIVDTVQTMAEPVWLTPVRVLYVSPQGAGISQDKNNPGKLDQSLLSNLLPGDKVILLEGTYYTGELNLVKSGNLYAPIVFEGENDKVWLNGGFEESVKWTRVSQDTNSADYNTFYSNLGALNTNCVLSQNQRLYPYRNYLELKLLSSIRLIDGNGNATGIHKIGLDGFFRDGRNSGSSHAPWTGFNPNTYIRFADGTDTTGKNIEVSKQSYCFKLTELSNIAFRRMNFRLYGAAKQNNNRTALLIADSDSIIIDSCRFDFCDHALSFKGSSSHNLVQHCIITDDFAKLSYFQFKETGLDYQHLNFYYPNFFPFQARNVEPGRIYFDHGYTGRGNMIRFNHISGGCDAITCPDTPGDSTRARHFDIYGNYFGEGSDDAFEVDGNAANIRVWGNTMKGAGNGISVASPCYGPVYIFRNVMRDFRKTVYQYVVNAVTMVTDTIPGSPLKLNASYCDLPGEVFFMHNTVSSGPDAYGLLLQQPQSRSSWSKVNAWNNIIYAPSKHYTLWVRATDSVDLNYNVYYSDHGFRARQDRPNYAEYSSLVQVQSNILGNVNDKSSGIEKNGMYIDPRPSWVDEKYGDFRLGFINDLHDKGRIITGLNDDFYGNAPDPGAFEFTGTLKSRTNVLKSFMLFPNPASAAVTINTGETEFVLCELTDYTGRLISSYTGITPISIDVASLNKGMYRIVVRANAGTSTATLLVQ